MSNRAKKVIRKFNQWNKSYCIIAPSVTIIDSNGKTHEEHSVLYKHLHDFVQDKGIINLLYASYLQSGVAESMDNAGFKRNYQGEHDASDVWTYFNMDKFMKDQEQAVYSLSREAGVVNYKGENVLFEDAEEALSKAKAFNDKHDGYVASVYQHEDRFEIIIDKTNSRTYRNKGEVNRYLSIWDSLKAGLESQGVDVNSLKDVAPTLVTPMKASEFLSYIYRIQSASGKTPTHQDIRVLIEIGKDKPYVQRMEQKWGNDKDVIADKILEVINGTSNETETTQSFVRASLSKLQDKSLLNVTPIQQAVNDAGRTAYNAKEFEVSRTMKDLNAQYGIGSDVIQSTNSKISKLSDAATEIAIAKNRELSVLKSRKGVKDDTILSKEEELEESLDNLSNGKFVKSCSNFLREANNYIPMMQTAIENVKQAQTNLEYQANRARVLQRAKNFVKQYKSIVESLCSTDNLKIDENVRKSDIELLTSTASEVLKNLTRFENELNNIITSTVTDTFIDILGDTVYNGMSVADIVQMSIADSTMMDYLYSLSRVSNPLIAGLNGIIRDANDKRDKMLLGFSDEIQRATKKLFSSGHKDTYFMYGDNGRVVSNYDWDEYYHQMYMHKKFLVKEGGLSGVALELAMKEWEKNNTEELVVDRVSGRTEMVPKLSMYHIKGYMDVGGIQMPVDIEFDRNWDAAQREYYKTMMDIKGRIGTLFPEYAQKQFYAPQVRMNKINLMREVLDGRRSIYSAVKTLISRMNLNIKEDDTRYGKNGIVLDSERQFIRKGDYNGAPLRQIPIFYVNKLNNQDELLHDFSGALQHLASTACNYNTINEIKDLVELSADYIKSSKVSHGEGLKGLFEKVENGDIEVFKQLVKNNEATNTAALLNGMIAKDIYGEKIKDQGKIGRILQGVINWGTFKALTWNVLGGTSNKIVGDIQNIIEGVTGEYFNIKDLIKARAYTAGSKLSPARIWDNLTYQKNTLGCVLEEYFDPIQEVYSEKSSERYYGRMFDRLIGSFNSMALYASGEALIHLNNMYAILFSEKVRNKDGKIVSLFNALKTTNNQDGTAKLGIKDGYTRIDGSAIDDAYLQNIKQIIRTVNQKCHGSMNTEDKGIIHRDIAGRAVLNFKQWMVEHYSRRYRSLHYEAGAGNVLDRNFFLKTKVILDGEKIRLADAFTRYDHSDGSFSLVLKDGVKNLKGQDITNEDIVKMREKANADQHNQMGFWSDTIDYLGNFFKRSKDIEQKSGRNWDNLSDRQKYNIKRCETEIATIVFLFGLGAVIGDEDETRGDEWWYRFLQYQQKRLLLDEFASTPIGAVTEAKKFVDRPTALTGTLWDAAYPVIGAVSGDFLKEQGSGRHAGENKYWYNIRRHTLPFWWDVEKLKYLGEDNSVFGVFDLNNYTR